MTKTRFEIATGYAHTYKAFSCFMDRLPGIVSQTVV